MVVTDVCIVGGGIIGLLTARELVLAGCKVVIVDQQHFGQEASWAGGGIVSPLYPWRYPSAVTALATDAQLFYPYLAKELCDETGVDPEYQRCGLLVLDPDDVGLALDWASRYSRQVDLLPGVKLCKGLDFTSFQQGLWFPDIAQVKNPRLLKSLIVWLEGHKDATLLPHHQVTGFIHKGGMVCGVQTEQKKIYAAKTVVNAGAWSKELLKPYANIPLKPVKGQMLLLKPQNSLLKHIVLFDGHYLIPRLDGNVLVGSTLENAGFDKRPTEDAYNLLLKFAVQLWPELSGAEVVAQWSGLRPATESGVPFISVVPDCQNLFINAGHFRNGLVLAPAAAQLMRDLICGNADLQFARQYALT